MALKDIVPWAGKNRELARRSEDPFSYLHHQIDQLFNNFLGNRWPSGTPAVFAPQLDITETDTEVKVCAELPGIESKDLDVQITDDTLTIRGEKRSERESDAQGRHWTERSYGSFERSIPLPTEVNGENASAEFKNGVLRLTLPKREGAKPRAHKINVT